MNKFKVGDRVRQTRNAGDSKAGQIGTVLEDSDYPWVEFDTHTSYKAEVARLSKKAGYCNCVSQEILELLEPADLRAADLRAEMILLLERAIKRVEMANEEGDYILSKWLTEAKACVARAKKEVT